ncbi:MAG: hypothetical protein WCI88_10150 [Chloroflexota bacterium]
MLFLEDLSYADSCDLMTALINEGSKAALAVVDGGPDHRALGQYRASIKRC